MAVLDFHRTSDRREAFFISRLVTSLVSSILAWNDTRRTEEALSRLSAHELDDIGISKADIVSMARR